MNNHFYVAIVAPFGSGKTTLMKKLVKKFKDFVPTYAIHNTDHETIEQAVELYPDNFRNKTDYIQSRILDNDAATIINGFKQTNEDRPSLFVGDSSYHEHYCYLVNYYRTGKLSSHKYARLSFKFHTILKTLPNPDMYVYLDVPVDEIVQNVKTRAREYEVKDYAGLRKYVTDLKRRYQTLFLTRRNYKYPHNLIQNMFPYELGLEFMEDHAIVESAIINKAQQKFIKAITDEYSGMPDKDSLKEYSMRFVGGTKCK